MRPGLSLFLASIGPAAFGAVGVLYMKRAAAVFSIKSFGAIWVSLHSFNLWIALGCYGVAFLWFFLWLPHVNVSQLYPISVGLNVLFISLAACLFGGEVLTLVRIMGLSLIILGVLFVAR